MPGLIHYLWLGAIILLASGLPALHAQVPNYTWTILTPEHDTRATDVRQHDEMFSRGLLEEMNQTEHVFHQRLIWQKVPLTHLLSASAPFCELDFDPVHPLILTAREKTVLKEFFRRGGFLVLSEDVYPYTVEEIRAIKAWPIIDFITRELPATDHDFTLEKVSDKHPIYHQYYLTSIPVQEKWAVKALPNLPDLTLLSYKGHPSVFVYANYFCDDEKWVTALRPFPDGFSTLSEDYAFNVNLYVYVSMH